MALASVTRACRAIRLFKDNLVLLKSASVRSSSSSSSSNPLPPRLATRFLSTGPGNGPAQQKGQADPEAAAKLKKKGLKSPQITLIMPDEHVVNDTLEHAEKMAKRRDLKLVKILDFDTKTERPLYRLMTNLEFFEESAKSKAERKREKGAGVKEEKLFIISSKIGEHDLSTKINQMLKLAKKKHGIRIFVAQDGNPAKAENVIKVIEEELKSDAEKVDQVRKATTYKVQFAPIIKQDDGTKDVGKSDDKKTTQAAEKKKKETAKN